MEYFLLSGSYRKRTRPIDLEHANEQLKVAVCTARATRNKKVACFCVTPGVIVASAAACTTAAVTHHHAS